MAIASQYVRGRKILVVTTFGSGCALLRSEAAAIDTTLRATWAQITPTSETGTLTASFTTKVS